MLLRGIEKKNVYMLVQQKARVASLIPWNIELTYEMKSILQERDACTLWDNPFSPM